VFLLYAFADKLIAYAWLVSVVALLILLMYVFFCRRVFAICRHHTFAYDKRRYTALVSFSGWSLFGSVANMGASQGVNILLNIFFGVFVNAAMGIANQVSGAISLFVGNFQTAFNPQIIKSYASGEKERFINLILNTSKYSYYLLFLIALPCFICCNEMLQLWLGEVPPHSVSFCRLLIIFSLIDAVQGPLWVSAQAAGEIRNYQLLMSFLILLNLPVSYVILKIIPIAELALVVRVLINLVTAVARVVYLKRLYSFPVARYLKEVVLLGMIVTIVSSMIPSFVYLCSTGWLMATVTAFLCIACTIMAIYTIGLKEFERNLVKSYMNKIIHKLKR
ncbi:MAG TPA: lipopolysaccharide biosynthesis protein, partial [Candidatus Paraprevotella stercorigallinarum]|nr:lipopolysaccharide biosynthesis protein [Candidatus Paraprevotella stercorigallinarum]